MKELYDAVVWDAGWAQVPIGILRMEGPDTVKWLHKIVTADVQHMPPGGGAHSALLDAKGHFVADFPLLRDGEIMGAFVDPARKQFLYDTLRRYIIREKVTITDVTDRWACITIIGWNSAAVVERLFGAAPSETPYYWTWGQRGEIKARLVRAERARVPAYDVMIPVEGVAELRAALQDLPYIPDELLELLRIDVGLPRWGIDFDESTLALEIPDAMEIRVDQGCYVGQEVVARIVHRGHVNRHLRGLVVSGDAVPARGDAILFEGASVGAITSSARSPLLGPIAMGYVRREVPLESVVQVNGADARVIELPFGIS